jgi:hypothetical protein
LLKTANRSKFEAHQPSSTAKLYLKSRDKVCSFSLCRRFPANFHPQSLTG